MPSTMESTMISLQIQGCKTLLEAINAALLMSFLYGNGHSQRFSFIILNNIDFHVPAFTQLNTVFLEVSNSGGSS
jgi:hypothetical protein